MQRVKVEQLSEVRPGEYRATLVLDETWRMNHMRVYTDQAGHIWYSVPAEIEDAPDIITIDRDAMRAVSKEADQMIRSALLEALSDTSR